MDARHKGLVVAALAGIAVWILDSHTLAQAQGTAPAAVPAVGNGVRIDPYAGGLPPPPPGYMYATQAAGAASQAAGSLYPATINPNMLMDPMAMGYVYGAGIPMTRTQAGLYILTTQQRMLGIGNGQLSGVRPGPQSDAKTAQSRRGAVSHPTEAHTANMNVPGGQAARYFNRRGLPATRPQPYFRRQLRNFPVTAQ